MNEAWRDLTLVPKDFGQFPGMGPHHMEPQGESSHFNSLATFLTTRKTSLVLLCA